MKKLKALLVVLVFVSMLKPMHSVRADIAPPPAPQLGGLEPFQYQDTNVQMLYERVEIEIHSLRIENGQILNDPVTVTAYFTMRNLGNTPESMRAIFPLESFTNCRMGYSSGNNSYTEYYIKEDSFLVTINGQDVPIQKVITDHPYENDNSYGLACSKMTWAGFDVTFPAREDVVIRVQYSMEAGMMDYMQNIEYILETGAGWAGPIQRAYVIVKFPYVSTTENVLSGTTTGYQFLYNEIFWSFENLEPTRENNIQVSFVSPFTWQKILSLRYDIAENPAQPEVWLELAKIYEYISTWHGTNLRNPYYHRKVSPTYEQGIAANPYNARLYANYAQFVHSECCFIFSNQIDPIAQSRVLSLANQALALDPTDHLALEIVDIVKAQSPNLTFTPPATIPYTATSLFTSTPTTTPSVTITPRPSETPLVVTVVHTKIVNPPTSTKLPEPTAKVAPTETQIKTEPQQNETGSLILGSLVIFAVGIGSGWLLSKRRMK